MPEFRMPSLGADMEEGTLLEWLVHPGDTVHKGDVVAVVDTAKAAVEVECFSSGVVGDLLVEPGTTVTVGTPLAVIGEAAAPAAAAPPAAQPPEPTVSTEPGVAAAPVPVPRPAPTPPASPLPASSPLPRHRAAVAARQRQRVTPYARRLARERGLDLTGVVGSGADGAVRARDLDALGPTAGTAPERPTQPATQPAASDDQRMREAIARLMSRSKKEIPHYYLRTTIDLQAATEWLREHNRRVPVPERLVPAALLLAATARAAVEVPQLNGYWEDDRLQPHDSVHLGVAVSLRSGGMVTPAVHDAQDLGPVELMQRLRDLVTRARSGRLRASELTDATLTVTNLGDQGVEEVLGVIYPPQVALVGFGTVVQRPWAVDGLLGVRPLVTATLSADHRATDGYVGARFLGRLDQLLQHPDQL